MNEVFMGIQNLEGKNYQRNNLLKFPGDVNRF